MSQQDHESRIVREIMDQPHIRGRRITVLYVYDRVEGRGLDPHTVADRHNLNVADVYRALAYYHDHPADMKQARDRRREAFEEFEQRGRANAPTD